MKQRQERSTVPFGDDAGQREPKSNSAAEERIAQAFGDYLARELRARNWTIRSLAIRSGVDHTTISRLIRGQRVPTLRTATRLNEALEGPDPGPMPNIAINQGASDPIQRVADALSSDPTLDARTRAAILRYYVRIRSAAREARGLKPDD